MHKAYTLQDFIGICCIKHHQTLPTSASKDFDKAHYLNNTEAQNEFPRQILNKVKEVLILLVTQA